MTTSIKEEFDKLDIQVTKRHFDQIRRLVTSYEMRGDNPLALNTSFLGVNKMYFTPADRAELFNIFDQAESEIKAIIATIPSVDTNRVVISDPFNLFVTYLLHRGFKMRADKKAVVALMTLLLYKFFTSLVIRRFPLGANPDIMGAVTEDLNLKFDVKVHGTWKKVIAKKSESSLDRGSLHLKSLIDYSDDDKIFYFLSDTQTRIRNQINLITSLYYTYKENNDRILSISSTTTVDGEKIMRESARGFSGVSAAIYSKVLNKRSFIVERYMEMVMGLMNKDVSKGLLMKTLISLSDEALQQRTAGREDKVINLRTGEQNYIGIQVLISSIVESIYKTALVEGKINMNNKMEIFLFVKRLYTSSRVKNELVLNTKYSLRKFVEKNKMTSRQTSISSLVVSIPLYITIISFDTLNK